jgi:hypothetical protein
MRSYTHRAERPLDPGHSFIGPYGSTQWHSNPFFSTWIGIPGLEGTIHDD